MCMFLLFSVFANVFRQLLILYVCVRFLYVYLNFCNMQHLIAAGAHRKTTLNTKKLIYRDMPHKQ